MKTKRWVAFSLPNINIYLNNKLNPWRYSSEKPRSTEAVVCMYVCMYVCLYLRFQGASTSQVIDARNEWVWMIMMAKWYSGTSTFVLQVRKNPEKSSPRKLVPTGDRTRARCVTGAHATTCSTAVDYRSGCCQKAMQGALWLAMRHPSTLIS